MLQPLNRNTTRADLALQQALVVLARMVRWLLRSGVNYVAVAQALKTVFLQEARQEIERTGGKATDSALSVLSGLHRKDVRALASQPHVSGLFTPTPAMLLFTRWLTHPDYRDRGEGQKSGERLLLECVMDPVPRFGQGCSFDSLARDISSDVHPRTLLEALVRLGLVTLEGEQVVLAAKSFAPDPSDGSAMELLAANVGDHLAAAVHNV